MVEAVGFDTDSVFRSYQDLDQLQLPDQKSDAQASVERQHLMMMIALARISRVLSYTCYVYTVRAGVFKGLSTHT